MCIEQCVQECPIGGYKSALVYILSDSRATPETPGALAVEFNYLFTLKAMTHKNTITVMYLGTRTLRM